jgi:hypothetical protein
MLESLIGPALSSAGLIWAMYTFFIKRRDEAQEKQRADIIKLVESAAKDAEREARELKEKVNQMQIEVSKVKGMALSAGSKIDAQSNLLLAQAKMFEEAIKRVEKTLDRHEEKLDNFGKIKVVS